LIYIAYYYIQANRNCCCVKIGNIYIGTQGLKSLVKIGGLGKISRVGVIKNDGKVYRNLGKRWKNV